MQHFRDFPRCKDSFNISLAVTRFSVLVNIIADKRNVSDRLIMFGSFILTCSEIKHFIVVIIYISALSAHYLREHIINKIYHALRTAEVSV